MIPCIVLPVFPLPAAEKTACAQMKDDIHRYVLITCSPLCNIGELRYRQNNTGYQISKIVKLIIFKVSDCLSGETQHS